MWKFNRGPAAKEAASPDTSQATVLAPAAPKPAAPVNAVVPAPAAKDALLLQLPSAIDAVQEATAAGCQLDMTHRVSSLYRTHQGLQKTKLSERYGEFLQRGKAAGMHEIEQLVPLLTVPFALTAAEQWTQTHHNTASALALLKDVPPGEWGYFMPLAPGLGTLGRVENLSQPQQTSRWRSLYRLNFIMGGLSHLFGGSLEGLSVLDIACNWGAFSIEASLRGAAAVDGFDIREQNVQRAQRLSAFFGVKDAHFSAGDVYDFQPDRNYDVVLNLGLMYHITRPFELVKQTYDMCSRVAVFDTVVHREPFSGFILGTGEHAPEHAATAIGCELHPTYRALIDLAYLVGFREVIELRGEPPAEWTGFATDPYGVGQRRCIVAFK